MIIDNGSNEVGDEIFLQATLPITGIVSFTDWEDETENESGSEFFEKYFAYTLDGINWIDYIPLTTENVENIPVETNYDVMFRFKYVRAGVSGTIVKVNWVKILSDDMIEKQCGITFENSVFAYFWECNCSNNILSWCQNVLEKLYRPGIVPQYIVRGTNNNFNQEDRDYIDFWRAISCFWATLVAYAREFERFHQHQELLVKYLKQRGMYVCENQPMEDLLYLMEMFYDEIRKRGTAAIAVKKGQTVRKIPGGTAVKAKVNGELLRLICYNNLCDEFLFSCSEFDNFGWVVDKWSPLTRTTTGIHALNKAYEKGEDIGSIFNYPIFGINTYQYEDSTVGSVLGINNVPAGNSAGIGVLDGIYQASNFNFNAINVDPTLSYEMSFLVRVPDLGNQPLTVKAFYFTADGVSLDLQKVNNISYEISNTFFERKQIEQQDEWYFVRCIIYAYGTNSPNEFEDKTPDFIHDIDDTESSNLRFGTTLGCKIMPYIVLDNSLGGSVSDSLLIRNFQISILNTPYSTGFLERADFVQTWIRYNAGEYTADQLKEIIKFYLLPYKAVLQANFI